MLLIAVATLGIGFYAGQTLYRHDDNRAAEAPLPDYYFAGDFFDDPVFCPRLPRMELGCVRASRAEVWWQKAQNLALVQAPAMWHFLAREDRPSRVPEIRAK